MNILEFFLFSLSFTLRTKNYKDPTLCMKSVANPVPASYSMSQIIELNLGSVLLSHSKL